MQSFNLLTTQLLNYSNVQLFNYSVVQLFELVKLSSTQRSKSQTIQLRNHSSF